MVGFRTELTTVLNDVQSTTLDASPEVADPLDAVLEALRDEDCRKLLAALDREQTAGELAQRCDLPRSTTYRKLGDLSEAGLVAERDAISDQGKRTTWYRRAFASLTVGLDDDGLSASLDRL